MRRLRARKVTLKGVERQQVVDYIKSFQLHKKIEKLANKHLKTDTNTEFWAKGLSLMSKLQVEDYFNYNVPSNWRDYISLDYKGDIFGQLHYWY